MDELTSEFVGETRETLERVGEALIAWETSPRDTARLDEIFRFVHTVKGSCGFLDLPRIEHLAHAAETALGDLRSGTRTADAMLVSAMLQLIDRIALLTEALEDGRAVPDAATDALLIAALDTPAAAPLDTTPNDDAAPVAATTARAVRISVELLDAMMDQISDLVLARNELARALRTGSADGEATGSLDRLSLRIGDLRDSIARARMQPVERLFAALPRLVRDTAGELGKSVRLIIEGSDVELDREMVEQLRDPLIHIVRNAIDHGVETPEARVLAGKAEQATLRITARQTGNQVAIEIADDGRGIDIERLRARAIELDLVDARAGAAMPAEAVAEFIFSPGLSTAAQVTAISGRGVGMDVARANIERLGGSIALDNAPGRGLTVDIRAPLTLSIITVLTIEAGGQKFAIPRTVIEEVFACNAAAVQIEPLGSGQVAIVRDEVLPLISLAAFFGAPVNDTHLVVVQPSGGRRYGLAVSRVCDHEEVVVRPVAPLLAALGTFAGQTLPDTGSPLLLLDAAGIARRAQLDLERVATRVDAVAVADAPGISVLTFTGLDGARGAVRTTLVDRIEDVAHDAFTQRGDEAFVMIDGVLRLAVLDGPLPETERIAMLRLSDGDSEIGYPVLAVHDLARIADGEAVPGCRTDLVLADGVARHIVDGHALFSRIGARSTVRPVALVAGEDTHWARTILAPLVEAAGYDVTFDAAANAAIVIQLDDSVPSDSACGDVIQLHNGTASAPAHAIHRYDRPAIEKALRQARARSGAG